MITTIISCIALVLSIIALIRTFKPKEKLEIRINDDLSKMESVRIECEGFPIDKFTTDEMGIVRRVK